MKQKLLISAGVAIAFIAEAAGAVVEFDKSSIGQGAATNAPRW